MENGNKITGGGRSGSDDQVARIARKVLHPRAEKEYQATKVTINRVSPREKIDNKTWSTLLGRSSEAFLLRYRGCTSRYWYKTRSEQLADDKNYNLNATPAKNIIKTIILSFHFTCN